MFRWVQTWQPARVHACSAAKKGTVIGTPSPGPCAEGNPWPREARCTIRGGPGLERGSPLAPHSLHPGRLAGRAAPGRQGGGRGTAAALLRSIWSAARLVLPRLRPRLARVPLVFRGRPSGIDAASALCTRDASS